MEENQPEILNSIIVEKIVARRRKLFPWWIKVFIWIFLIFGALTPLVLILGITGLPVLQSLYGIETYKPISVIGFTLTSLFILKGITAYDLWTEKDWAISLAQIDAFIGIVICVCVMFIYPFVSTQQQGFTLNIRLELAILIPFLIKLGKIKNDWKIMSVANIESKSNSL
jgi:hypothetical protein